MTTKRRRNPRGMGSVWEDKAAGCWWAKITVNGKTKRFRARSQKDAMAKLRAYRPLAPGSAVTMSEYLDRWLADLQGRVESGDLTAQSVEWKRHALHPVFRWLGSKRLDQLLAIDVEWLLREMAEAGLSRNTIKHTRGQLALALDRALANGLVTHNAARLSEMPAGIQPSKQKRESMTPAQARALLAAAKGERLEALFVTALLLGLRPGELLGLRWRDVDFDRKTLSVEHGLQRDGTFGRLKTEESRAMLDMPGPVVEALKAHKARQAIERLKAGKGWRDTDAVFATRVGTPTDDSNLRRLNRRLCEKAGLGKWTPHEYRHTAGSLLLDLGVPREEVRRVLRHKNLRMLDEVYGHEVRESVNAAVGPMEQLFGN